MSTQGEQNDWKNPAKLDLMIFRGNNSFTLYEDDGETNDFEQGCYAKTTFRMKEGGGICSSPCCAQGEPGTTQACGSGQGTHPAPPDGHYRPFLE